MRRFTRLTNAFSKKVENHKAMIAVHYMHYNFARVHKTLRVPPAMEAGVADHAWSLAEIARLASSILYFGPQRKLRANDPFEIAQASLSHLGPAGSLPRVPGAPRVRAGPSH